MMRSIRKTPIPLGISLLLILLLCLVVQPMASAAEPSPGPGDIVVAAEDPPDIVGEYVPDEIIVKFKEPIAESTIRSILSEQGSSIVPMPVETGFKLLKIQEGKTVPEMVQAFSTNPDVEYAEPNYIDHDNWAPNDSRYQEQWHLNNPTSGSIHMEAAWDIEQGGNQQVIVAVLDSGVAYENYGAFFQAPDLAGTHFVAGWDFVNNDSHPNDDYGHGTHVAGTIAQTTNNSLGVAGVAFGCSIMPVKTLDASNGGSHANFAAGVQWAINHGANVINYSAGGSDSQTKRDAVIEAYNAGVTVIASTGNNGGNVLSYPAAYDDYVIAVGATRFDETKSYYSNYGTHVDLVAPGGDVTVDQNGDGNPDGILQQTFTNVPPGPGEFGNFTYQYWQGTSMAAPHVSGVAALLISHGVTGTDNVRQLMQQTAKDLGSAGRDDYYGWGLVDAFAALQAVPPPPSLGEALDNTTLTWTTGGSVNWFGQTSTFYYDGDAAQSGDVNDGQSSYLQTTVNHGGYVSFYCKVSSEANFDYLRFYIDGVEQPGSISGNIDWTPQAYYVQGAGAHTLRWEYSKNGSISQGSDCGWVDWVQFKLVEGDVNLDGSVTLSDSTAIRQYLLGLRTLTPDQLKCADTNDNGSVSLSDSTHIRQWLLDPDGHLGILYKPLWQSPADDDMAMPLPRP